MEVNTKGFGKMVNIKVREQNILIMEVFIQENGKMIKLMDRELIGSRAENGDMKAKLKNFNSMGEEK